MALEKGGVVRAEPPKYGTKLEASALVSEIMFSRTDAKDESVRSPSFIAVLNTLKFAALL